MLPFLGLGGAMAIEDAIILGRCIQQQDRPNAAALRHYERIRKGRADLVAEKSRLQGVRIASLDPEQVFVGGAPPLDPRLYNFDPDLAPI